MTTQTQTQLVAVMRRKQKAIDATKEKLDELYAQRRALWAELNLRHGMPKQRIASECGLSQPMVSREFRLYNLRDETT